LTAGKVKSGRREGVGASQRAARKRPARGPAAQPQKYLSTRCGHENDHENDSDTLCDDARTGRRTCADRGGLFVRSNPNGSRVRHDRVSVLRTPGRGEARRAQVLLSQWGVIEHRSACRRGASTTLADFSRARDSQITFSVTHGWSAFWRGRPWLAG